MVSLGTPPAMDSSHVRAFAGLTNVSRALTALCSRPYLDPPARHTDPHPNTSNKAFSHGLGPSAPEGRDRMAASAAVMNRCSVPLYASEGIAVGATDRCIRCSRVFQLMFAKKDS